MPMDLPPGDYFSLIYYWYTREADPKELEKFNRWLYRPLPGQEYDPETAEDDPHNPWSAANETAAFQAVASSIR